MHIKNCSFRLMFKWTMNNFVIITFVWFGKFIFIYTYKYCIHMNIIRIQFNISSKFNIPLRNTKFSAWNKENIFKISL